ncbi:MAG TPA: carboxypeptidase regulatory-like domain-containing protein [Candidatus Salinicoccus stercoripullorum]|uniref:Carboxypeptidase regulatory-like domain-containing protein n=1 Tax=Candidatus Salinicoccus stercoripullorum TaxID=2838756 RepID=A0A9D1QHI2_9STAP|nr:carboxypeptidase regulatory-like domain-containing protein [Candidatus Salinicoccus stercoripullorum]
MRNIIKKWSAVALLLLVLIPAHGISANTEEEPTVEESAEQPSVEESTEQPQDEESTEEPENNYSNTEEEYPEDSIPPQNEQPRYEEPVEDFYQSYEEPAGEYYEEPSAEQTAEETVEEYTEEVTEEAPEEQTAEPEEEAYAEPETTEEPAEVTINHKEAEVFSITGEVVEGDTGMENVTVILSGDGEKEAATDENGTFSFKEMPPGDYELQMEVPDGYTAKKEKASLTIEDRGKRGITFVLEEAPVEEGVETHDRVMSGADESPNNMPLIVTGAVLLVLMLILFAVKALRK